MTSTLAPDPGRALGAAAAPARGALLSPEEKWHLGGQLVLALSAIGLLLLAMVMGWWWPEERSLAQLVAGVAAALVAAPIMIEAWHSLRHPSLHGLTDQLVAVAVMAAWAVGDLETAALVPLLMILGHVLEERSLIGSRDAISALSRLTRTRARRVGLDGAVAEVASEALVSGDRVEVRAGDRIPTDGTVFSGHSSIDTAPITGEGVPVEVAPGDGVHAGTINLQGRIEITVTRVGAQTTLGQVVRLMRDAEKAKPPITRLLERFAGTYLILVLLVAAGTLFISKNFYAMMTVVVAACPCALVLAAPATAVAAIAVAGRHGILVKGSAFLEELADVDAVILDKTGTVTLGELVLVKVIAVTGSAETAALDEGALRRLAGSIGAASSHPVSRALARAVPVHDRIAVNEVTESSGLGVRGMVAGLDAPVAVALGRAAFLSGLGIAVPTPPEHNGPLVGVAKDGIFQGWLLLADEPRAEARAALNDLRALGLNRQVLLTGDRRAVAEAVAARLGITTVEAEVVPEQKLARVRAEISAGRRPLVVGDGINDALALKAGAVGVAMGAKGTDVALASADIVLTGSDLRRLGTSIRLSRMCRHTIAVNVGIGLGWTALIIAGAAAGLYGPAAAAVLHNIGTLIVMANAGRLLRFDEPLTQP